MQAAAAAAAEAKKHNWKLAISVVDPNGDLVFFQKMDGTQVASAAISQGKARTAARYRRETRLFFNAMETGHPYVATLDPTLVASPGGFPLMERQADRRHRLQRRHRRSRCGCLQGRNGRVHVIAFQAPSPGDRHKRRVRDQDEFQERSHPPSFVRGSVGDADAKAAMLSPRADRRSRRRGGPWRQRARTIGSQRASSGCRCPPGI